MNNQLWEKFIENFMDIYLNIIIKRDKIINVSGMKSDKKL